MTKSLKLKIAGGILAAVAVVGGAVAPAQAATAAELQAQIQALLAQIQALQAGGQVAVGAEMYVRNLTVGSTGTDVSRLQSFLVQKGFLVMPQGVAMGYFGPLTRSALARYQASVAISPAVGYFGPITRAHLNAMVSGPVIPNPGTGTTTTPVDTTLKGGEGEITNIDTIGDVESDVDEGDDNVKVLGVEFDAEDSDIAIERVDVDFTKDTTGDNGSDNLDDYVTSVSLVLDGKVIATQDVDEADEEDDDTFSFRFTGLKGIVREGKTANLYVTVDAISNLDTQDEDDGWDIEIPEDGIRAVDAANISDTYVDSSDNIEETFTFNGADAGELEISEADSNPEDGIVVVDDNTDTNDVVVLAFDIEANDQAVNIQDIPVGFTVSGITNVGDAITRVRLMEGSTVLKTETVPSSAGTYEEIVFDDLDLDLDEDDSITLKVVVDVQDQDSGEPDNGDTIIASTTSSSANWDVEDENGDDASLTGSAEGETQTFNGNGILATVGTRSAVIRTGTIAGDADIVDFTIKFTVKNLGDDDIYIDGDVVAGTSTPNAATNGFAWATTTNSNTGTTTAGTSGGILTADDTDSDDTLNSGDIRYQVESNDQRNFTFKVSIPTGGDNGALGVRITGFDWDTTDQDNMANLYTFNLDEFKTETVTGLQIH